MQKPVLFIGLFAASLAATPAAAQLGGRFGGGMMGDATDWFAKADANADGKVTRAEFASFRVKHFDQLDRNKDGVISPADFPRIARARPEFFTKVTAMMGDADKNGDGAISRAELAQSPPRMFDIADANRDNAVTKTEFNAARDKMKALIAARGK